MVRIENSVREDGMELKQQRYRTDWNTTRDREEGKKKDASFLPERWIYIIRG